MDVFFSRIFLKSSISVVSESPLFPAHILSQRGQIGDSPKKFSEIFCVRFPNILYEKSYLHLRLSIKFRLK